MIESLRFFFSVLLPLGLIGYGLFILFGLPAAIIGLGGLLWLDNYLPSKK